MERQEGLTSRKKVSPDLILLDLGVNAVKGVFFTSKEIAGFLSLCGASLSNFKANSK